MVCLPPRVVIDIQCMSFFGYWIVLLGRMPVYHVFTVADNWVICNSSFLIDIACISTFCPNTRLIIAQLFIVLITSIEPPHHFMQYIFNSIHTTSTIPRSNFMILRRNIGPIPIISVTIVTPVEVVVAFVVSISDIMTLTVIVTID